MLHDESLAFIDIPPTNFMFCFTENQQFQEAHIQRETPGGSMIRVWGPRWGKSLGIPEPGAEVSTNQQLLGETLNNFKSGAALSTSWRPE